MMLPASLISANRAIYYLLLSLAICLALTVSAYLSKTQVNPVELSDYRSYQCTTGNTQSQHHFRVLTLFFSYATQLADALCNNDAIRQEFSSVEILWRPRAYLSAAHILDEQFDIFWNRYHVVNGLVPEFSNFYSTLQDTPTYKLFWLSKSSAPQLNANYLKNKTIGFSRDPQSQTHYLQPMSVLRQTGITLTAEQQKFYTDPSALYKAFYNNEVDIISSPLPPPQNQNDAMIFSTLLDDAVSSGAWFIKNDLLTLHNIEQVKCAVLNSLSVYKPLFNSIGKPSSNEVACSL